MSYRGRWKKGTVPPGLSFPMRSEGRAWRAPRFSLLGLEVSESSVEEKAYYLRIAGYIGFSLFPNSAALYFF